jgi:hypothetical protein
MTDATLTARFLALFRLKWQQGTAAKLWISQVLTRKALLEDPKLRAPIELPECLYLEILSRTNARAGNHCLRKLPCHRRRRATKGFNGQDKIYVR